MLNNQHKKLNISGSVTASHRSCYCHPLDDPRWQIARWYVISRCSAKNVISTPKMTGWQCGPRVVRCSAKHLSLVPGCHTKKLWQQWICQTKTRPENVTEHVVTSHQVDQRCKQMATPYLNRCSLHTCMIKKSIRKVGLCAFIYITTPVAISHSTDGDM